jgi:hypothetical protein
MEIATILKFVEALNRIIENSLVKKSWKPNRISLEDYVENTGNFNLEDWIEENSKYFSDEQTPIKVPDESIENMVNSTPKAHIWHHLNKDKANSEDSTFASKNVIKLLRVAKYIQKSADIGNIKHQVIRLIDSHANHVIGLISRNNINGAKEYLEAIRPQDWERNLERNVDKIYEQVIRVLAEKLEPEIFQALGL